MTSSPADVEARLRGPLPMKSAGTEWAEPDIDAILSERHEVAALLDRQAAPVETAEVIEDLSRAIMALPGDTPSSVRLAIIAAHELIDHLTSTVAARDAEITRLTDAGKTLTGWREHDYPAHFDRWTAQYLADRYRAALAQEPTK